jgi:hypothetical protein
VLVDALGTVPGLATLLHLEYVLGEANGPDLLFQQLFGSAVRALPAPHTHTPSASSLSPGPQVERSTLREVPFEVFVEFFAGKDTAAMALTHAHPHPAFVDEFTKPAIVGVVEALAVFQRSAPRPPRTLTR